MPSRVPDGIEQLGADRSLLERTSVAERVADVLRARITEGAFPPGTRLPEEALVRTLAVSRNTLRESFRLLAHERLVVHELNRGVFVRTFTADDVVDLYRMRRFLECSAVRYADGASAEDLAGVERALLSAEAAAAKDDWVAVGTQNLYFHQAIAGLAGSRRVADTMRLVLAELRLAFHVMGQPRRFHEPYLALNRTLYELLADGDLAAAERYLVDYLDQAERQLITGFAELAQ